MGKAILAIKDLHVSIEEKEIVKGLNLTVKEGETHALMGPNGSGKSTLSYTILGHPRYTITSGDIQFNGQSILELDTDKRAQLGLFLGFQYPSEIAGVSVSNFLRTSLNDVRKNKGGKQLGVPEFQKLLAEKMKKLRMDHSFAERFLNEGFSGGEKKRSEILQLAVLQPKIAILDEPDSGLDIDALKSVAKNIKELSGPALGILMITHYERILHYVQPDKVHVMMEGRIVKSGGKELARALELKGYDWIRKEAGL